MPFQYWPKNHPDVSSVEDVVKMYKNGFAGCEFNSVKVQESQEQVKSFIDSSGGWSSADNALHSFGLAGSGAGKLSCIFPIIEMYYPGALPGPGQERGDCVSHSQKNAELGVLVMEVYKGLPDEKTGEIEGIPKVPSTGIANGVISSEYKYWFRGHGSDGWQCGEAARVSVNYGIMVRKAYPELDIDLTKYSGKLAGAYGRSKPGEAIQKEGQKHKVRTITQPRSFEELRDLIANGYAVSSCGGEGFSSSRDSNGVSKRSGSWSHAMAYLAVDDRSEIHAEYGEPLVLVQNSWGKFNSGPRKILGTSLEIPHGSFWARWSDIRRRSMYALSGVFGWPPTELPNFTSVLS